jgi:hypothetical protein
MTAAGSSKGTFLIVAQQIHWHPVVELVPRFNMAVDAVTIAPEAPASLSKHLTSPTSKNEGVFRLFTKVFDRQAEEGKKEFPAAKVL